MFTRYISASLIYLALHGCAAETARTESVGLAAPGSSRPCTISAADREWLVQSIDAWHFTSQSLTEIDPVDKLDAFVFNAHCALSSSTAMTGLHASGTTFTSTAYANMVTLPDGSELPPGPISFTQSDGADAFFVMSLPSVWRHNDVDPGPFGLEKLMTAVLLHEATHVVQSRTYGREIDALSKRFNLPDDFNDDSIQERFEDNAEFADSVARETALFFEAAASPEREQARTLASRARDLMRQRRNRWFVGDEHYLSEAEDLWLSLEGSGQWAGYRYLVAPDGGAVPMTDAMSGFGQRGKWWSQKLGLAMALTLDTLGYDWKTHAYGESTKTLSAMIDEALGQ